MYVNGVLVKENFLSPDAVEALKVSGDIQCGLLHVYTDGHITSAVSMLEHLFTNMYMYAVSVAYKN